MRIRTFILATSAAVAVIFFGGSLTSVSRAFDAAVQAAASDGANAMARWAFASMYEVMSRGWDRAEAERFFGALRENSRLGSVVVQVYRAPLVVARFGEIEQPPMDAAVLATLAEGHSRQATDGKTLRDLFPLVAEAKCLRCHKNAHAGATLGVIEVRQDLSKHIAAARGRFLRELAFLLPLGALLAIAAVLWVNRRLEGSLQELQKRISGVNAVADLRTLALHEVQPGFSEVDRLFAAFGNLVAKMRAVAIDKEILRFEIGLLEKFIITSDVVKDWHEYVAKLLIDINRVMVTHVLFSVFKIDDELFDLEIFWHHEPVAAAREMMERFVRDAMTEHPNGGYLTTLNIRHHVADPGGTVVLSEHEVRLRVKTFLVESPKIGGIVGIGVHSDALEDETLHLVMDSVLSTLLNVVGSVKAIHKYTRDLEYYATRDPLTDLFNRRAFWELLSYEVLRAQRHGYRFSVLMLDLDNFKLVNDGYGHALGDRYLQEFAHTVRRVLRLGDVFARHGGDEFALILPDAGLAQGAMVAERILEAAGELQVPAPDGATIRGTVSIGLAAYPEHATDPKDLFVFADNMLYRAKSEGKRRVAIPTEEDVLQVFRDASQKGVLVLNAVENRNFIPVFQPILDIKNGNIAAFEVLSRIESDGRLLGAAEFIELAERMGVIHKIDQLVIEQALDELGEARFDGHVFINLSPRAIVLNEFSRNVRRIVAASRVRPEQIVFEITERDTVKNISLLERFLNDLKFEGFKLAIDDFGSGFSSFHYLRRFPIDFLKVEGDFIVNMLDSHKDRAFVQHMRALAHELGIRVVAEYVENERVLEEVRRLGIDFAQGYHIGRPVRDPVAGRVGQPAA